MKIYAQDLCKRYRFQQPQVIEYYEACKALFPVYVDFWKKHPDVRNRTPVYQEEVFDEPYKLPSGRVVRLRGKFDSVDVIGKGKERGIWLQENKTKGDIREDKLRRQLVFDLQTMFYLVALILDSKNDRGHLAAAQDKTTGRLAGPGALLILGVRYNVIARPLSGGKGSIVQHQATKGAKCPKCKGEGAIVVKGQPLKCQCPKCGGQGRVGAKPEEPKADYYNRLGAIIREEPGAWFMRWQVRVYPGDINKFVQQFLNPILEQLCDWWTHVTFVHNGELRADSDPFAIDSHNGTALHWRHPFGTYNVIDEGGFSDVDEYMATGSEVGLERIGSLFPELPSKRITQGGQ